MGFGNKLRVIKNLTRKVAATLSSYLIFMLANFIINEKLIVAIIKQIL